MLWEARWIIVISLLFSVPIFVHFGLYRSVTRYLGYQAVYAVLKSVSAASLVTICVSWSVNELIQPRVWIVYWLMLLVLIGGSRMGARYLLRASEGSGKRIPVAIYGAGTAGAQLATALQHSTQYIPLVFIDDKPELQDHEMLGVRIHPFRDLDDLIERLGIQRIFLATPSASRAQRQEILSRLEHKHVEVQVMPDLMALASGRKRVDELTHVPIEDLLGRDPVPPKQALLDRCIKGKSVLVTGAGGSIGSELCRQILTLGPTRLVLFERSEYALYAIERELRAQLEKLEGEKPELMPILGSVDHRTRMQSVISTFGVQTIYHAAAYKHVPIVEANPIEGVMNNIFGTLYAAEAALAEGVETFVLVSTDKAVRPTNVMGATKRFAELILQALALSNPPTRFTMVRFGNVLASSGSVVPVFQEQIRRGGPVTVTDPDVVRYFMTIPEAAQLVIQAGSLGNGGDVFVLDMGKPVKILDLARRMIHFSGLTVRDDAHPMGDIEIAITGLRDGEKLYEELLIGDNIQRTEHKRIFRAQEQALEWPRMRELIHRFGEASHEFNYMEIRQILLESVEGYQPTGGIRDWVWIRRSDKHADLSQTELDQREQSAATPTTTSAT
ncbi:putative polysaccharide biosynthesis protein capd [Magnetofaba australis IT-1]|uniref:Putative polysaccharide biosynthesis protein capd n=2 Tax=Magnetofaba TaxID=1472292 RepID=A0A1Y2K946_9PROT|nr:putative polysaccharide biosynthesis protein capd [Magnetofaba australis IT-1]